MKTKNLLSPMALLTIASLLFNYSTGESKINDPKKKLRLRKPDIVDLVFVNYNNWSYVMRNNGSYMYDSPDQDGNGNNAGGEFPRGSGITIVYAGGLYIGALKDGIPVVSETEFSTEFQPGRIVNSGVPFGQLKAEDPLSPLQQVYLIDKTRSGEDYLNWPQEGLHDALGRPSLIADAKTWAVFNDLDTSLSSESVMESPNPGLGIEVVLESFAFNAPKIGDVVFLRYILTNKTNTDYAQTYLGAWMDADVGGNSGNDIIGTDTTRSMEYVYNNSSEAPNDFAVGFDLLQGPVVHTAQIPVRDHLRNQNKKSVLVYDEELNQFVSNTLPDNLIVLGAVSSVAYIGSTDPIDNSERYHLMRGANKWDGSMKFGCGENDYFVYRNGPFNSSPCDMWNYPTDQRILISTGPFTIKAGESQEIWVGVIGASGTDRFDAVANLWETDDLAQSFFDAGFPAPAPPEVPNLTVTPLDGKVVLSWQNNAELSEDLAGEILGIRADSGYSADYVKYDFQGYRVYRSLTGLEESYELLAQYDVVDTLGTIVYRYLDTDGILKIASVNLGSNTGLRYTYTDSNLTNGQNYFYAVTAYDAQPYIAGPEFITLKDPVVTRYAEGTAIGLSNIAGMLGPTGARVAFLDSLTTVDNDPTWRPGGVPGILEDTITIDTSTVSVAPYNEKTFVVLDAVGVNEWGPHLAPVGGHTQITRTLLFFACPSCNGVDILQTVNVNVVTLREMILPTMIPKPAGFPVTLESSLLSNTAAAVPSTAITSVKFDATVGTLAHTTGVSDGYIEVQVVDPEKVTGHTYRIEFSYMPETISGDTLVGVTPGQTIYKVFDVTASAYMKFSSRSDDPRTFLDRVNDGVFNGADSVIDERYYGSRVAQFDTDVTDEDFLVGDGILWKIYGPAAYFNSVKYIAGAQYSGASPAETRTWWKGMGGSSRGNNNFADQEYLSLGIGSPANGMTPYNYVNFGYPVMGSGGDAYNKSVKIVFSRDSTKWQYIYSTTGGSGALRRFVRVPFQIFEIDPTDGQTAPRQLNARTRERNTAGGNSQAWGLFTGGFIPTSADPQNDGLGPQTRGFVFVDTTTYDLGSKTGHYGTLDGTEKLYAAEDYFKSPSYLVWTPAPRDLDLLDHPTLTDGKDWNLLCRSVIGGTAFNQGTQGYVYRQIPDEGTIEAIVNHPYTDQDTYTFTTTANSLLSKAEQRKNLKDIRVVPNPFYKYSSFETSYDKLIKFTNLPSTCTIRIFTVAGDLVKTIKHNSTSDNDRVNDRPYDENFEPAEDATSIERWDLKTANGHFVASGMYIALVESSAGKRLVKFAVIQ